MSFFLLEVTRIFLGLSQMFQSYPLEYNFIRILDKNLDIE